MQVEIWSDVVCPWCYLGRRHLEQALAGFAHRGEVDVTYRSFELDPSAPPGATTPTAEMLARYAVSGAQPPEVLTAALERAWAETGAATGADLP